MTPRTIAFQVTKREIFAAHRDASFQQSKLTTEAGDAKAKQKAAEHALKGGVATALSRSSALADRLVELQGEVTTMKQVAAAGEQTLLQYQTTIEGACGTTCACVVRANVCEFVTASAADASHLHSRTLSIPSLPPFKNPPILYTGMERLRLASIRNTTTQADELGKGTSHFDVSTFRHVWL
jgi:hypothetical protein